MDNGRQDYICDRFPTIFAERDLGAHESCMGRGLACGDGWYAVLWDLCIELEAIEAESGLITVAQQVKEKFGTLCFYAGYDDAEGLVRTDRPYVRAFIDRYPYPLAAFPTFLAVGKRKPSWLKRLIRGALCKGYASFIRWLRDRSYTATLHAVPIWLPKYEAMSRDAIRRACKLSAATCEDCGADDATTRGPGWVTTLCQPCRVALDKRKEAGKFPFRHAEKDSTGRWEGDDVA